jgi:lipopolysaccharide assembly outer membrane protein LptD (OstA)
MDGDIWVLDLSSQFLDERIEQYGCQGRYKLREDLSLLGELHYDARLDRLNELGMGIQFSLSAQWDLYCGVSKRKGAIRGDDTRWEFKLVSSAF